MCVKLDDLSDRMRSCLVSGEIFKQTTTVVKIRLGVVRIKSTVIMMNRHLFSALPHRLHILAFIRGGRKIADLDSR